VPGDIQANLATICGKTLLCILPLWTSRLRNESNSAVAERHYRLRIPFPGLRVKSKLLNRINLICPVQSRLQKFCGSRRPQITSISAAIPPHTEGRFAIVTDVRVRDAVDAAASGAPMVAGRVSREQPKARADERR
jgi:hypothetical protein